MDQRFSDSSLSEKLKKKKRNNFILRRNMTVVFWWNKMLRQKMVPYLLCSYILAFSHEVANAIAFADSAVFEFSGWNLFTGPTFLKTLVHLPWTGNEDILLILSTRNVSLNYLKFLLVHWNLNFICWYWLSLWNCYFFMKWVRYFEVCWINLTIFLEQNEICSSTFWFRCQNRVVQYDSSIC